MCYSIASLVVSRQLPCTSLDPLGTFLPFLLWGVTANGKDAVAGRLQDENLKQSQKNIAMMAELMHLRSVAEDNKRLQAEVDQLAKVSTPHAIWA